jgi:hypothetical protein
MLSALREHIISKLLWVMMALILFNLSVDTPEPNIDNNQSNLGFNDQETVLELVLETVLGIEDAIAEREEHEGAGDTEKKKSNKIKLVLFNQIHLTSSNFCQLSSKKHFPVFSSPISLVVFEKEAPPPEA